MMALSVLISNPSICIICISTSDCLNKHFSHVVSLFCAIIFSPKNCHFCAFNVFCYENKLNRVFE